MIFKFITGILFSAVIIGCNPIYGGDVGIDLSESPMWDALVPGFDSPHLHPVVGGDAVPLTTASPSATTTTTTPNVLHTHYAYYEHSPRVTALQMVLGMKYVDGVYGPNTRSTHIDALGGPTAVLYRNYPEIGQTPIPCSRAHEPEKTCLPGDGHYELPTLGELINQYFQPEDRALARMIAFCESSGQTHDIGSEEVSDALAIGWFQHLAKYWQERSERAGFKDHDPFNGRANVGVAAWLFYNSGVHHWNPSRTCWEERA